MSVRTRVRRLRRRSKALILGLSPLRPVLKRLTLRVSVLSREVDFLSEQLESEASRRLENYQDLVRLTDSCSANFFALNKWGEDQKEKHKELVERVKELEEADHAADLANDSDFLRDVAQSVTEDLEIADLVRDALSDILSNATKPHR